MVVDLTIPMWFYPILVWTLIWKGIAMWKSARNNQMVWFVASLVINTFGILPIVYLFFFQQDWNKGIPKKRKRKVKKKIKKVPRLFR